HGFARFGGFAGKEPVPELGIVPMRIEQRVRAIRLHHLAGSDGVREPPVVGLAGELEHPTRHRHRDPCGGELRHERVEPFPGRFACDRYAAARRSTSFSCSSSRFRFLSSRNSAASVRVWPGLAPSSISARRIHFCSVIGWTPKSFAICSIVTPGSRLLATRTTSSRNSVG